MKRKIAMKQYIVDAFADRPFTGNPAAVCIPGTWPDEAYMKALAMENNLSETAYIVQEGSIWRLRWFTPGAEVALCGHATLASAFVVLNYLEPGSGSVSFSTLSGILTVTRKGDLYEMDFPRVPQKEIPVTEDMALAFGHRPAKAFLGVDLVCVFQEEETVRTMRPDMDRILRLPGRLQNATAPGGTFDFVSRSFAPALSIPEDPVCGSAHCQLAPYWAEVLGKKDLLAFQASRRGGALHCTVGDKRVQLRGNAVPVAVSDVLALPEKA